MRRTRTRLGQKALLAPLGALIALAALATGCPRANAGPSVETVVRESTREDLVKFRSQAELDAYRDRLEEALTQRYREMRRSQRRYEADGFADTASAEMQSAPAAEESEGEGDDESITNNQEQGVDEGGIVKLHGDHLVMLRRGRLFTVDIDGSPTPISMIDVTPPGENHDAWYDEMLVHDDTIVVVGFNYHGSAAPRSASSTSTTTARSARRYEDTFVPSQSNDYYSSPQLREPPHRQHASSSTCPTTLMQTQQWEGDAIERDVDFPGVRCHQMQPVRRPERPERLPERRPDRLPPPARRHRDLPPDPGDRVARRCTPS